MEASSAAVFELQLESRLSVSQAGPGHTADQILKPSLRYIKPIWAKIMITKRAEIVII